MAGTWVVIPEIRFCDMCKESPPAQAYADGKTTLGPWADMCKDCYAIYGVGLGLGRGQELLLEPPDTTKEEDEEAGGEMPADVILGLWEGLPIIIEPCAHSDLLLTNQCQNCGCHYDYCGRCNQQIGCSQWSGGEFDNIECQDGYCGCHQNEEA